ncbi:hypothetical protein Bbelb_029360 [Branchiostoma belcheri]|nr:hypothetical protein Bbelb_029360 [Branchiostoma belcheri]
MPQISTTDNPVEAIHHMVLNDRFETVQRVAEGQTINGVFCAPELRHLRATITEKMGEKLRVDVLSMHLSTRHKALWAFYLFPKLGFHLRGQRFHGDDGVIDVV